MSIEDVDEEDEDEDDPVDGPVTPVSRDDTLAACSS